MSLVGNLDGSDARKFAPATARNREPILAVLRRVLPERGRVLEIASGTGEHAVYFAERLPGICWQPSDVDESAVASVEAWRVASGRENVEPPVRIDVTQEPWPVGTFDAVFSANMIHIAPWECCLGLLRGAAAHLGAEGVLVTYGPYAIDGEHTAASNEAFDASLRSRDPRWGVRELGDVIAEARAVGLIHRERIAMPANNFMLTFQRDPSVA